MKLYSIKEAAQIIGTTAPKVFKALRDHGALIDNGNLKNTPKIAFIKAGYLRVHHSQYNTGLVTRQHITTRVTPTGLAYIAELLQCDGNKKTSTTSKATPVTSCAPCE